MLKIKDKILFFSVCISLNSFAAPTTEVIAAPPALHCISESHKEKNDNEEKTEKKECTKQVNNTSDDHAYIIN